MTRRSPDEPAGRIARRSSPCCTARSISAAPTGSGAPRGRSRGAAGQLRHRHQRPARGLRPRRQRLLRHATTTAPSPRSTAARGDDSFQIGQLYGMQRDASRAHRRRRSATPFGGSLTPHDVFAPSRPRAAGSAPATRCRWWPRAARQRHVHRLQQPGGAAPRRRRRQRPLRRPRLRARADDRRPAGEHRSGSIARRQPASPCRG